ncbi:putative nuclease HARBI1 [Eupeodes corollae]|uniref:putative nuclease HARBI1 n=1 Tax=Eupeodes corollae TaxID=290404 RepID=UPI002492DD5E|nr:putative nuclease HARBI1 [Eupeodes corollae]
MDKGSFKYICDKVSPEMPPSEYSVQEALSVEMKVAIAIYKLASCAEYKVVGNQFRVHKATVKNCVYQFGRAMVNTQLNEEIKLPNEEQSIAIIQGFEEKSGVSQILGAIDDTHIPVKPLAEGCADYINRKGWPSMVLQAVVDCNYLFLDICCKHPGSVHES